MIGPLGPAAGLAGSGRTARRGAGFALPGTPGAAAASAAASTGGIGALFGLQEELSPRERDDAAQRRGQALLEEMDGLRRDLLRGAIPHARLARIALLSDGESGADPELRAAMEALSLRAQVEMARYSMPGKGNSS